MVHSIWDAEQEKWFMSIVDVVSVLTESPDPQVYWRVLKKRLKDEGNETATNCNGLKLEGGQLATNCSQLKMQDPTNSFQ